MTTDTTDARRAMSAQAGASQVTPPQGAAERWYHRPVVTQLVRFAVVGAASTVAYGLLFLLLRQVCGAFVANALALLITAVANTAVNRRITFGVRGGAGLAGDHAVGLLAFGAGLALTTGSLAALDATGSNGRVLELVVLTVANAVATLMRFVLLRFRISPSPVPSQQGGRSPVPS